MPYDIHSYAAVTPSLASAGFRVIVPYLRGYGTTRFLSGATFRNGQQSVLGVDAIALMDALGIPDAIIGGFDWGARTANVVAVLWPDRCRAMVSVSGYLIGTLASPLTRDDLLDNITLYWLTNTGISAARLYWENKADFFNAKNISIPYAMSIFPDELYQAPRSWAERAYPRNLIHYNRLDRGGHFAGWEQPALFAGEMRASFRSLR